MTCSQKKAPIVLLVSINIIYVGLKSTVGFRSLAIFSSMVNMTLQMLNTMAAFLFIPQIFGNIGYVIFCLNFLLDVTLRKALVTSISYLNTKKKSQQF